METISLDTELDEETLRDLKILNEDQDQKITYLADQLEFGRKYPFVKFTVEDNVYSKNPAATNFSIVKRVMN